jgi:acyl-CoA reductase-like NAD-dependent aldehyde dehydrogenase
MNYPLNETYATLIPALLMGNVVLMKVPTVGKKTSDEAKVISKSLSLQRYFISFH